MALTKRNYVDGQTIITAANLNDIQDHIITVENNYVPKTRTVAGKALSSNITLAASDVGAVPTSRTINAKALTGNITLSAADVGAVPVARTVNGKALSSNITLNAADVSAVPTTRTVNGKALSSNITLASGDIGDDSGAGGSTVKASLAALKGSLNTLETYEAYRVTGTISSSSLSITKSGVTADMVPVACEFGTSSNVLSNYTITTAANKITFSGITLGGSTTVDVILIKAN